MFFTKDDACIVCDPKGEYLKRNRKGEKRMLEKCLEKCEFCGAEDIKVSRMPMLKYRAWWREVEEMCDVFQNASFSIREAIQSKEVVLLQSAQITSIEGFELFEGDIVRLTGILGFHRLENEVCVIKKSKYHVGLVYCSVKNGVEHRIFYDSAMNYTREYLGNIYENPELV
ncbi:TPA: hypothetical protein IU076_002641 [Enterococcus faecalis]|nr:hypothetical protein [Enterococcus faecalis]